MPEMKRHPDYRRGVGFALLQRVWRRLAEQHLSDDDPRMLVLGLAEQITLDVQFDRDGDLSQYVAGISAGCLFPGSALNRILEPAPATEEVHA